MLTRRKFLLGSAVTSVAGGAAAVGIIGPRKVFHAIGVLHSPDHEPPASGWPISEYSLPSAAMRGSVSWAMAVPTTPPTALVLCLHGRNGDHHSAFSDNRFHDAVAEAGHAWAVASVDAGPSSYYHHRADGRDAEAMIMDELLPAIDDLLGTPLPRALVGWSMGGYGALHVASRHSDAFLAAAAGSPALWRSFSESSPGAFDDEGDFADNDVFADRAKLAGLVVRVDCGTDDGFLAADRDYAAGLPAPNPGGFSEGFHEVAYWRSIAPAQIATLATVLP